MFRQIFIALALFLSLKVSGQSLAKLDINNGFKKFKFGMSPTQISNLKVDNSITIKFNDVTEYKYVGGDIKQFSGVEIDQISLSFYNNKLYQIMVSFGTINRKYTDREYDLVDDALKATFGTNTHNCQNTGADEKLNCLIWDAKKVRLEHIRFNLSEPDGTRKPEFNYVSGYIFFICKPIEKEQQNSEL